MRAYWPIVETYFLRGAWCWLAARAVLSLVRLFGGLTPLRVSTATSLEIAALAIGVGFLETMRRRERALIGNLAVHPAVLLICFGTPALAGEAALRLMLRA
jgi:hypothetical protein